MVHTVSKATSSTVRLLVHKATYKRDAPTDASPNLQDRLIFVPMVQVVFNSPSYTASLQEEVVPPLPSKSLTTTQSCKPEECPLKVLHLNNHPTMRAMLTINEGGGQGTKLASVRDKDSLALEQTITHPQPPLPTTNPLPHRLTSLRLCL